MYRITELIWLIFMTALGSYWINAQGWSLGSVVVTTLWTAAWFVGACVLYGEGAIEEIHDEDIKRIIRRS